MKAAASRLLGWSFRGVLTLLATFLVGRAAVELVTLNPARPESYHDSWGGPHYLGVLLVHAGPGLLVVVLAARHLSQRRRRPDHGNRH